MFTFTQSHPIFNRCSLEALQSLFNEVNEAFAEPQKKTPMTKKDNNYIFKLAVPGAEAKNVVLSVEGGKLLISATVQWDDNEQELKRSLALSDDIDAENIRAEVKNGLLTVILPIVEKAQKRTIVVN